jgi:hypothetical protein
MNADGGTIAWASLMAALVVAYIMGMKRDPTLNGNRMLKIALIWVGIIGGAYFLVRTISGMP